MITVPAFLAHQRQKVTRPAAVAAAVLVAMTFATSAMADTSESSSGRILKDVVSGTAVAGGVGATGIGAAAAAAGTAAVTHSSGAAIATTGGSYVAGTLGTIGAGALSVASAPVWIVGGVLAIGAGTACYFWC